MNKDYCYMIVDETTSNSLPVGVFDTALECANFLGCDVVYVFFLLRWETCYKGMYRVIKIPLIND